MCNSVNLVDVNNPDNSLVSYKKTENSFDIEQLPPELLNHIFGFLDISTMSSVVLVCKSWSHIGTNDNLFKTKHIASLQNLIKKINHASGFFITFISKVIESSPSQAEINRLLNYNRTIIVEMTVIKNNIEKYKSDLLRRNPFLDDIDLYNDEFIKQNMDNYDEKRKRIIDVNDYIETDIKTKLMTVDSERQDMDYISDVGVVYTGLNQQNYFNQEISLSSNAEHIQRISFYILNTIKSYTTDTFDDKQLMKANKDKKLENRMTNLGNILNRPLTNNAVDVSKDDRIEEERNINHIIHQVTDFSHSTISQNNQFKRLFQLHFYYHRAHKTLDLLAGKFDKMTSDSILSKELSAVKFLEKTIPFFLFQHIVDCGHTRQVYSNCTRIQNMFSLHLTNRYCHRINNYHTREEKIRNLSHSFSYLKLFFSSNEQIAQARFAMMPTEDMAKPIDDQSKFINLWLFNYFTKIDANELHTAFTYQQLIQHPFFLTLRLVQGMGNNHRMPNIHINKKYVDDFLIFFCRNIELINKFRNEPILNTAQSRVTFFVKCSSIFINDSENSNFQTKILFFKSIIKDDEDQKCILNFVLNNMSVDPSLGFALLFLPEMRNVIDKVKKTPDFQEKMSQITVNLHFHPYIQKLQKTFNIFSEHDLLTILDTIQAKHFEKNMYAHKHNKLLENIDIFLTQKDIIYPKFYSALFGFRQAVRHLYFFSSSLSSIHKNIINNYEKFTEEQRFDMANAIIHKVAQPWVHLDLLLQMHLSETHLKVIIIECYKGSQGIMVDSKKSTFENLIKSQDFFAKDQEFIAEVKKLLKTKKRKTDAEALEAPSAKKKKS